MKMCKRNNLITAVAVMCIIANSAACGELKAVTPQEEATTVAQEEQQAEVITTSASEETTTEAAVETVVEETTTEEAVNQVVYEGIDMNSTLPGKEWMKTFDGIITEPKFVVFNDTTNKKVIVEDGQEVEFEDGDVIATYYPAGAEVYTGMFEGGNSFTKVDSDEMSTYYSEPLNMTKEKGSLEVSQTNSVNGEDIEIHATLIFK